MATDKTVILITGANSGIGLETVAAIAQVSSDYEILLASRSVEKGQKALADLQAAYPGDALKSTISPIQLDILDQKSVATAKEHVEAKYGKLDILINNAGIIVYRQCDSLTNMRETFETNVFAQALVTETFEPLLKKSKKPYVIYVSSNQGSITSRLDPSYKHYNTRGEFYRMSKAALNMLSACHRYNFADWGCRVCAFNPDWCVTNLTGEAGRVMREQNGARDAKEPASALRDIVEGKRDDDFEKNGMVDLDGGVIPW